MEMTSGGLGDRKISGPFRPRRKLSIPVTLSIPSSIGSEQVALRRRFSNVGDAVSRKLSTTIGWRSGGSPPEEIVAIGRAMCTLYVRTKLKRAGVFNRKLGLTRVRSAVGSLGCGALIRDVFPGLACACSELERMQPKLFTKIARQTGAAPQGNVAGIVLAVGHHLLRSEPTWGKIVAIYCVAGGLAVDCVRQGRQDNLHVILEDMTELLEDRMAHWVNANGGWLFRHGDKTPTTSFPKDPYFNISYWPEGRGQLTNKGKNRQYNLGKWLKKRFISFLPDQYSTKDIYVRSTDVDRTLNSAAVALAGMYPPKDYQVWNNHLLWQPIPIHTVPLEEDQILYMDSKCPKFDKLYEEIEKYFKFINKEYSDFYKNMSKLTGWNITNFHIFADLQSVLYVYSCYNASYLPSWYNSVDLNKIEFLTGLHYAMYTIGTDLKRLGVGPFLDYLLNNFDNAINDVTNARKLLLLSAHESSIASILNTLGLFDRKVPQFSSALIWELRKSTTGTFYLNFFYKKNSSENVEQFYLKKCGFDCNYEQFKSILEPIRIDMDTWKFECNL